MSDPLTWSPIRLGRWFGTSVRVHFLLIAFVVLRLLASVGSPAVGGRLTHLGHTASWLGLLLLALALHELGHAIMASWLEHDQDEVHLWPLGSLVGPSFRMRSSEQFLVALAGPLVSASIFLFTAIGLALFAQCAGRLVAVRQRQAGLRGALGRQGAGGADGRRLDGRLVRLLELDPPARQPDPRASLRRRPGGAGDDRRCVGGRVARQRRRVLGARGCSLILGFSGLYRLMWSWGTDGWTLIAIAMVIEYMLYIEARMLEEGGYFDDGVFGYDFSEGYTSLEAGAAKVRPYGESALKRWRRRRSDLRRERRMAREAAEERRMDEILEKLYREGRAALSDEENRFLVRVSTRFRNRTKHS